MDSSLFRIRDAAEDVVTDLAQHTGLDPDTLFVGGGAVVCVYHGWEIKDFDVFSTVDFGDPLSSGPGSPIVTTPRAFTYDISPDHPIQLIRQWTGHPVSVMDRFDLSVCRCWAWPAKNQVFIHPDCRNLMTSITSLRTPVNTLGRLLKYVHRGVAVPSAEQLTPLVTALQKVECHDVKKELKQESGG